MAKKKVANKSGKKPPEELDEKNEEKQEKQEKQGGGPRKKTPGGTIEQELSPAAKDTGSAVITGGPGRV